MIASDVINQALRLIGVIAIGESPDAEDAATGLEYLNDMLAEWYEDEVGLQDYTVASQTTTLNATQADKAAIAHQLALRMAPEYGWEPSPSVTTRAEELMAKLRTRYAPILQSNYDHLPGVRRYWNILTGEN